MAGTISKSQSAKSRAILAFTSVMRRCSFRRRHVELALLVLDLGQTLAINGHRLVDVLQVGLQDRRLQSGQFLCHLVAVELVGQAARQIVARLLVLDGLLPHVHRFRHQGPLPVQVGDQLLDHGLAFIEAFHISSTVAAAAVGGTRRDRFSTMSSTSKPRNSGAGEALCSPQSCSLVVVSHLVDDRDADATAVLFQIASKPPPERLHALIGESTRLPRAAPGRPATPSCRAGRTR